MNTSKEVGLYSPCPFPYICKNENDPSKCKRLLLSSPSNWSYSAHQFSIGKSISSCPLTFKGRITLILPLEFSIRVTLKCDKRCKGVFLCKLLIERGYVGAHVQLVQVTIAFSVVWHTQKHCNGPKTFKNGLKLIFLDFLKGGAFAPVAPPLDPPLSLIRGVYVIVNSIYISDSKT